MVVSAWATPLIVNLALSKLPEEVVPATQKLTLVPGVRVES